MTFDAQHAAYQARCQRALEAAVSTCFTPGSKVSEAAEYALMNGGKRVRGVLTLAISEMLGGDDGAADTFAAAVEMIHAFSLVHDDLPAMDDDDMRRGKPATHIAYGEATALLAGDLLAVAPFGLIAGAGLLPAMAARAAAALADATAKMIYGQELDLKYENEAADETALLKVHEHKTGALITAAARLGAAAANAGGTDTANVTEYTENIGLVFQIVDDMLDTTSTTDELGKPVGSDAAQGKTTFVTMFGLEKARAEALRLTGAAAEGLRAAYGDNSAFLAAYAQMLARRVK